MVISSYLKLSPFISGTACEANRTNQVKRIFSSTKRDRILPNTKRDRILPNTKRARILPNPQQRARILSNTTARSHFPNTKRDRLRSPLVQPTYLSDPLRCLCLRQQAIQSSNQIRECPTTLSRQDNAAMLGVFC